MPYRVKIVQPSIPVPFYWPGYGEEPLLMNKAEAEKVIADMRRMDGSRALWGSAPRVGQYELDWVKSEGRSRR